MKIETAADWAISNGYSEIETDTSDEFVAWQGHAFDPETEHGPSFTGVKVWRKRYTNDFVAIWSKSTNDFVAIRCYENGGQMGEQRGFGETMLAALQDL